MAKLLYLLVLALASCKLVYSQTITCYDCDPQNFASDCEDPVANNARTSVCTPNPNIANGTSICLSAYLNITGGTSGIHRGCHTLGPAVADFCDWFREERQGFNTTVVSCVPCNTTRCNSIGFKQDGSSGGHNVLATGAFVLLFNAVLVILLSGKE